RDKFKNMGLRVLMSVDPGRALQRYRQQYFHLLVVDIATAGEDGLEAYKEVQKEASKQDSNCPGILLMADERDRFRFDIPENGHTQVLTFPLKKGELEAAMAKLLPTDQAKTTSA